MEAHSEGERKYFVPSELDRNAADDTVRDHWRERYLMFDKEFQSLASRGGLRFVLSPKMIESTDIAKEYRNELRRCNRQSLRQGAIPGACVWSAFCAYLWIRHHGVRPQIQTLFCAIFALIAVAWIAASDVEKLPGILKRFGSVPNAAPRNVRMWIAFAGIAAAWGVWILPHWINHPNLVSLTVMVLLLLYTFLFSVVEIGRRWLAVVWAALMAMMIGEPLLFPEVANIQDWNTMWPGRILAMALIFPFGIAVGFKRSRQRKMVFALTERNNALLAFIHALDGDDLKAEKEQQNIPEPSFTDGSTINSD